MVFEPSFTKVVSSTRKNLGIIQSVIDVKLPTNENNITEIYSVGGKSIIVSSSVVGSGVEFVGVVDIQAMYNSGEVSAIDYSVEFKDKFTQNDDVVGEVVLNSNVIDISSSVVAGGVKVVAIVETSIDVIENKEINVLTKVDGEKVYSSMKEISYATYVGRAFEKFDVSENIVINNAEKIYTVTPSVCVTNVVPKENYVSVEGVVGLDICYGVNNEISGIRSNYNTIDFQWEIALDGIEENSYIQSQVSLLTNEIKITTAIEDGNANMNINLPINYSGYVFKDNNIEVVDDVYLEDNYLSITSENFDTINGESWIRFKDNISGTASILESSPFIDEVLGVSANNIVLASSVIRNDVLTIEGIVNSTVLYYTKDTNSMSSVVVEMPFVVEEKVKGEFAQIVTLCVSGITAKSKRGKEIEVSAELVAFSDIYNTSINNVISTIVMGDEKPKEDCSLYIYIAKPNQTLWDIAKDMGVSVDLIREQNPELMTDVVFNGGEKIIIYKPQVVMY